MFILDSNTLAHLEMPIPKMAMVSQNQCYLPLVVYSNPLTGYYKLYFYINSEPTLYDFEKDLARCLGKESVIPKGQGRIEIYNWDKFEVDNRLPFVKEGIKTSEVYGVYTKNPDRITISTQDYFKDFRFPNNYEIIETVYTRDYTTLEYDKSARVMYTTEDGLDFRYAWNIELLSTNPNLYILGTKLLLTNGINLEFVAPVFTSQSFNALRNAILKMYTLDLQSIADMKIFPIQIAHISEEVEDIYNVNRIDKYHVIVDMMTGYAYIRSLKDINPLISQVKGLPNPTPNNRLMPVYSF